jgi:cysteine synthase A
LICDNVMEAIGSTPLIKLNRVVRPGDARVVVKFEAVNVGGSIKTRTAYNMIKQAMARGDIDENSIIVEPTSGNQGIGLALVCAAMGLKSRIIMPDSVSEERRKIVSIYGSELVLVHDAGNIGECISKCISIASQMAANDPRVFIPQQFENPDNVSAQVDGTAAEILKQMDGPIDGFCSGVGTGGTLTGCGKVFKQANPDIKIWVAEPENAAILSGGKVGTHMQMGIGDGIIPKILDRSIYDRIVKVSDEQAIEMSRRLAREEGLLCGISSGSNVVCALELAHELGPGKTVVTILPDTGERYFSTPLFD